MIFDLKNCITQLKRTPSLICTLLEGVEKERIHTNEGSDTWSPFDIVGHLIHGEKTDWMPRINTILSKEASTPFEPFDRFAQFENSRGKTIDVLLKAFADLRAENVKLLSEFDIKIHHLGLKGIHPEFGPVTLKELLATWVVHDLSHLNQMSRVLAKHYIKEVGPWKAYISILD